MPPEEQNSELPDTGINLDAPIGEPDTGTGEGGNPAWGEVLGVIPKEFHQQIMPHLQSWDQGVQQKFKTLNDTIKSFDGYKQFVDNRIAPNDLLAAYQVFQRINQQPLDIYNRLGEMLRQQGLLQEQQQQQPPAEGEEDQQPKDPRIDQLLQLMQQQQLQSQQQQLQVQQQQQIQQFAMQVNDQVTSEFQQLGQAIGGEVPPWLRTELLQRATFMTEQQGRPISILEAFQNWQQVQAQAKKVSTAPKVVPSGGGFPQQLPNADALKSIDGRAAAVKDIIDRMNNQ